MTVNTIQISDEELLQGLAISPFPDELKEKFKTGLPNMSPEQKEQLTELIKKGYKEEKNFETKKQESLAALNEEYAEKLKVAQQEEQKYIHTEFEKFEQSEDQKAMDSLDAEIAQL